MSLLPLTLWCVVRHGMLFLCPLAPRSLFSGAMLVAAMHPQRDCGSAPDAVVAATAQVKARAAVNKKTGYGGPLLRYHSRRIGEGAELRCEVRWYCCFSSALCCCMNFSSMVQPAGSASAMHVCAMEADLQHRMRKLTTNCVSCA